MRITTLTSQNTDTQIKKAYAKELGLSQRRVKVIRKTMTREFDDFTNNLVEYLISEGYKFHTEQVDSVNQTSTQGGRATTIRVSKSRIIENNDFCLVFNPNQDGVELYQIIVKRQGQGLGSKLMDLICDISEAHDIPVYLKPVPFMNTTYEQLKKFYHKFGFRRCCKNEYWSNF